MEHKSAESIQLSHELQGSLSMSQAIKMTIYQRERVVERQECTHAHAHMMSKGC